ncbi:MAG: hypothetical protein ASUL_00305 [Candidatus Aramenus sulfurataquae]|jgi:peptidoglycan hydrolase CwlO-like protein|uniref:Uncharacterized protein n=2 Tax=Candidatus Aramenus sulfurataquae TaxID=1326980 RepID=W7L8H2_9CREN|nr:MAG: hypothetical protein ASUL_00305 [Candidatus Aramenus sulfurataquae]MCL7343108.1 hypothetical protein [Candidatus Aramenus sulfurataquae]
MKFRIDKIPKTDEDLEEIQREVEQEHQHEHHHHHEEVDLEHLLSELYAGFQSLQSKADKLEKDNDKCKQEISRIYKILSRMLIALSTNDQNEKIKNLKEILSMLE